MANDLNELKNACSHRSSFLPSTYKQFLFHSEFDLETINKEMATELEVILTYSNLTIETSVMCQANKTVWFILDLLAYNIFVLFEALIGILIVIISISILKDKFDQRRENLNVDVPWNYGTYDRI